MIYVPSRLIKFTSFLPLRNHCTITMLSLVRYTIASLCATAAAQQYAGDTISGSLPSAEGAEIAYFRVSDPSGANDRLTLLNYYSLDRNGQRLQESAVERAVIMNFGQNRNAADYEGFVSSCKSCRGKNN